MKHPVMELIERRKAGLKCAIPSFCTANELVIEAIMEDALRHGDHAVLLEATANQVNQFGGYTGMEAADFAEFVRSIAKRTGLEREKIILGGDHLGPLIWCHEKEAEAMEKAEELIRSFVLSGFTKIHLDTSMRLGGEEELSVQTVADRGARLYCVGQDAFREYRQQYPDALEPVYIIGSEVPVPGGSREKETVSVTSPEDFERTLQAYEDAFQRKGIRNAWRHIAAVVVQPGVEFSGSEICTYSREKAASLCGSLKKYPNLMFEGHSTDYQGAERLREMAEDGVGILKVGPALTFALREALFALHMIEKEILPEGEEDSGLMQVLENRMLEKPENWEKHYQGDKKQQYLARKYSFSDRIRYYLGEPQVCGALEKMFLNLSRVEIPAEVLSQYMPIQYQKVRSGILKKDARELAKDAVVRVLDDYRYAAG